MSGGRLFHWGCGLESTRRRFKQAVPLPTAMPKKRITWKPENTLWETSASDVWSQVPPLPQTCTPERNAFLAKMFSPDDMDRVPSY